MQRLRAVKATDGEWDERIDWNDNDGVDTRIPSDKDILTDSIHDSTPRWRTVSAFADHTTFHALYYVIGSNHHPVRRIIWAILILMFIIFFSLQISWIFSFYYQYFVYTTVSVQRDQYMKFPAVSICNLNGMKASVMNGTELDKAIRQKYTWYRSRGFVNGTKYDIDAAANHDLDDMMFHCGFYRNRCTPKNFTSFTYLFTEKCFTFNSGEKGHPVMVQKSTGRYQGFRIRLNIEYEEYYFGARAAGIRVFVHQQGDVPVRQSGHLLAPGTSNHLMVTRKRMERLPMPFKTGCRREELEYFKVYTQQNCWNEYVSKTIVKNCGCKMRYYKGKARYCTRKEMFTCVVKQYRSFRKNGVFEKNCPMPCEYDRYQIAASSAVYPSHMQAEGLGRRLKLNKTKEENLKYLRENVLELFVFYDDFHYEVYRERPLFRPYQLSYVILVLIMWYFGVNVFTIFEFLDFIIMLIVRKVVKWRKSANNPSRM